MVFTLKRSIQTKSNLQKRKNVKKILRILKETQLRKQYHKFSVSNQSKAWLVISKKSFTLPLYLKIGQSISRWFMVWCWLPQLGLLAILHLYSISLHRPCPVLSLFRLRHSLRGRVNSLDLAECESKLNRTLLIPLFDHVSFHTSFGLKSVVWSNLAVTMAGLRDLSLSIVCRFKSLFSGICTLWPKPFGIVSAKHSVV